MSIRYVGAIVIQALEPEKLASWYERHVGFNVNLEHEGGFYGTVSTERGPFHFGISQSHATPGVSEPCGVVVTFRVDDLDARLDKLGKEGITPDSMAEDDEGKYAMFRDPEGNQVSFWGE